MSSTRSMVPQGLTYDGSNSRPYRLRYAVFESSYSQPLRLVSATNVQDNVQDLVDFEEYST